MICQLVYGDITKLEARCGLRGATVARLTPDQKVACSNHVGVNVFLSFFVSLSLTKS